MGVQNIVITIKKGGETFCKILQNGQTTDFGKRIDQL